MQVEEFRRNHRSAFDETGTNGREESTTRRLYSSNKLLPGLYLVQRTSLVVVQL